MTQITRIVPYIESNVQGSLVPKAAGSMQQLSEEEQIWAQATEPCCANRG